MVLARPRLLRKAEILSRVVLLALLSSSALAAPKERAAEEAVSNLPLATESFRIEDHAFAAPYVDLDEWRDTPERHRYVHGGFRGTDTRFSFHFPAKDRYDDRFFQYITPVPGSETISQGRSGEEDRIAAALNSGAIFVETNGGGPAAAQMSIGADQTIGAYRANAAAAQFVRHLAQSVYGPHRTYGYAYGGSGGAYRTIGSIENTTGVWDGAVPFVMGSPMAIPNMFTVRLHAMRVLGAKFDDVIDALDAGGGGDPYASLDNEEAAALREVTRMGFQPQAWYAWRTMGPHAFALLFGGIRMADPTFFENFWNKPGYEGHDRPEVYEDARIQLDTRVVEVISVGKATAMGLEIGRQPGQAKGTADLAWQAMGLNSADDMPVAFRLSNTPPEGWLLLSDLILPSGQKLNIREVVDDIVVAGINDPRLLVSVKTDDAVRLDNSDILAVQTYHRHQVPQGQEYPTWNQYRDENGEPLYPQRPMLLGPLFTRNAVGSIPTGQFDGKMIVVESLWDQEALPWQADWYRDRVKESLGDAIDQRYRLWMTDRALHGDHAQLDDPTRVVPYLGVLNQALRDLAAWVQLGVEPAQSTNYELVDGQIVVPEAASERAGIQPVVSLTVDGGQRIEVQPGQVFTLNGVIETPEGAGSVIEAQWDFDGAGSFPVKSPISEEQSKINVSITHSFDQPGTYFPVLRGVSQREGRAGLPQTRLYNLDRVRVVVK